MKENPTLNIFKRAINQFSMEWCPDTGERLSEPHGMYGEGQVTCPPCEYTEETCWLAKQRADVDREFYKK